jgi:pimeloyl-ACP methyl ester carboxylesterase
MVTAMKSGCPVVPVAIGGLRLDWTPETVVLAAMGADDKAPTGSEEPPFRIHVRIGKPLMATDDPQADTRQLRDAVAELMQRIPGLRPAPGESDPAFGKLTLRDGRTLAYMDRGPRTGTPVFHFHGFQGSRLERMGAHDDLLAKLHIRLITPDRPGIGLSTPARGRTVVGWAADVRQLAGHLLGPGEPFSILGFSAGATYALACGQIPGLRAISLVAGLGLPHLIANWRHFSQETWRILLSAKLANFRSATFLRIEKKHRDRLRDFKHHLEALTGNPIMDDALCAAIALCNENRQLLAQAAALRTEFPPRISGSDALPIIASSTLMPKAEHNAALRQFLAEDHQASTEGTARIYVEGHLVDDCAFYQMVEASGATIVAESNRAFDALTDTDGDPLEAINRRYLFSGPHPSKSTIQARVDTCVQQVESAQVDGVIFAMVEGQHPPHWDYPEQEKALHARGIPTLCLPWQPSTMANDENVRQQVASFIESLKTEVLP